MEVKVLSGQNFLDIAIQHTGNVTNAYAIAKANNKSITDNLDADLIVIVPDSLSISTKEVQYLKAREIKPATSIV